jgi:hypothetical protein
MKRFHGIISMLILSAAVTMAIIVILPQSWLFALIYLAIIMLSFFAVSFLYCAKCRCRLSGCAHIIIGKLSLLVPKRTPGSYTPFDILGTFAAMGLILFFPQYWLVRYPPLCIIFWCLAGAAFLQIFLKVCTACENRACALNRRGNRAR